MIVAVVDHVCVAVKTKPSLKNYVWWNILRTCAIHWPNKLFFFFFFFRILIWFGGSNHVHLYVNLTFNQFYKFGPSEDGAVANAKAHTRRDDDNHKYNHYLNSFKSWGKKWFNSIFSSLITVPPHDPSRVTLWLDGWMDEGRKEVLTMLTKTIIR